MTRKHFNAIADSLRFSRPIVDLTSAQGRGRLDQWQTDCLAMADTCKSFNGRFDRDRFLGACSIETA